MRDKQAEKRYLKERGKGKSIRKAAKAAGVPLRTAARAEGDPKLKSEMAQALEKVGATKEKIALTVLEAMDATKVISANVVRGRSDSLADEKDGMADAHSMTKDFVDVPDFQARIKAAELAGKFRGDFTEKVEHSGEINHNVNFTDRLETARKRASEALKRGASGSNHK